LKTTLPHTHFNTQRRQPRVESGVSVEKNFASELSLHIAQVDENNRIGIISQLLILSILISGIINLILIIS